MKNYFKNIEIAEMYKISPNTVGNWIEAAQEKKINLQLYKEGDRFFISKTPHNNILLKELASKGKKYKNLRSLKVIKPSDKFYEVYSDKQTIDIINNIEAYKEIDLKYSYFAEGAITWNKYVNRVLEDEGKYTVKSTIQLLQSNSYYLFSLIKKYKHVNIVDIGPGNGVPVKQLLQFFADRKLLKKYIAIDLSPQILEIATNNVKEWFGDQIEVESYVKDINYDTFRDILFINSFTPSQTQEGVNIILFLGSTIENQRLYFQSLSTIKNSMGQSDIFVLGHKLDTQNAKMELNFNPENPEKRNSDLLNSNYVLDLLNLPDTLYDVEKTYNEAENARTFKAVFNTDIEIRFKTKNFSKNLYFSKGEGITFFRHGHHSFPSVIQTLWDANFNVVHATTDLEYEQILAISMLKTI